MVHVLVSLNVDVKMCILVWKHVFVALPIFVGAWSTAAGTAIVKRADRNPENNGLVMLTKITLVLTKCYEKMREFNSKNHAKELSRIEPVAFPWRCFHAHNLVFRQQPAIVPGTSRTMELNSILGISNIEISDKWQITALFCSSLAEDFLCLQLIYQGKTISFPEDWHVRQITG